MKYPKRDLDRRTENRCSFIGVIPGRIVHRSHELKYLTLDVSRKGLGILLAPCPPEGEELVVEFDNPVRSPLRFTVKHIYGAESTAGDPMHRCGIELAPGQSNDIDLIEIFTRYHIETL